MLRALAAGQHSPRLFAVTLRGVPRRKVTRLEEVLDCSFFT